MERLTTKPCERCGAVFAKPPATTYKVFAGRRFCGRPCAAKASGLARTKLRPPGWKRDRGGETAWVDWSLNHKSRLRFLCSKARTRAKAANLRFDITPEHLFSLWDASDGRCPLTGRTFDLTAWGESGHTNPNAPSVDRIKPVLGYTIGNVRLIVSHMNLALGRYGDEAFRQLAQDFLGFGKDEEW
ncbi:MAG: hypothetical protein E6Q97_06320 [Desulfurellales bacterium]|nr:MAG: hypothetical protein E6Q97_06320 [Desulfurellales bacterium]